MQFLYAVHGGVSVRCGGPQCRADCLIERHSVRHHQSCNIPRDGLTRWIDGHRDQARVRCQRIVRSKQTPWFFLRIIGVHIRRRQGIRLVQWILTSTGTKITQVPTLGLRFKWTLAGFPPFIPKKFPWLFHDVQRLFSTTAWHLATMYHFLLLHSRY